MTWANHKKSMLNTDTSQPKIETNRSDIESQQPDDSGTSRFLLVTGATLAAVAVATGAFGAHVVEGLLTPERFDIYQTAVQYHFYHALGLLITGITCRMAGVTSLLQWSGYLMLTGVIIFSGSLYLLTLTDTAWLGAITPIGGVAFITAWILYALGVYRQLGVTRR